MRSIASSITVGLSVMISAFPSLNEACPGCTPSMAVTNNFDAGFAFLAMHAVDPDGLDEPAPGQQDEILQDAQAIAGKRELSSLIMS